MEGIPLCLLKICVISFITSVLICFFSYVFSCLLLPFVITHFSLLTTHFPIFVLPLTSLFLFIVSIIYFCIPVFPLPVTFSPPLQSVLYLLFPYAHDNFQIIFDCSFLWGGYRGNKCNPFSFWRTTDSFHGWKNFVWLLSVWGGVRQQK